MCKQYVHQSPFRVCDKYKTWLFKVRLKESKSKVRSKEKFKVFRWKNYLLGSENWWWWWLMMTMTMYIVHYQ